MARRTTIITSSSSGGSDAGGAVMLGALAVVGGLLAIDHHYSKPGQSAFDRLTTKLSKTFSSSTTEAHAKARGT